MNRGLNGGRSGYATAVEDKVHGGTLAAVWRTGEPASPVAVRRTTVNRRQHPWVGTQRLSALQVGDFL